ncbi:MAG: hypothetical protein IKS66_00375 [Oscillospiraceae bacterium]|nr:hypothetical protein [Oscillospiraceae bacterium]
MWGDTHSVYRSKRRHGWLLSLPALLLAALLLLGLWLFFYLQRFLVYEKETLGLSLPAEQAEDLSAGAEPENPAASFSPVEVEIVVDKTDFSAVPSYQRDAPRVIRGRFLASTGLSQARLEGLTVGMGDYDALILELKPASGLLSYQSFLSIADSYRVNGSLSIGEPVEKLKARDVYLIARLSALVDNAMATRYSTVALRNQSGNGVYLQNGRAWLDPFHAVTRDYLADLMHELKELGFDEILFDGLSLPSSTALSYSSAMTAVPDPVAAVSSLALFLREEADALDLRISVQVESEALLHLQSALVGQDLELFFKLFDRVAFSVGSGNLNAALSALRAVPGEDDARLLPLTDAAVPGLDNWAMR